MTVTFRLHFAVHPSYNARPMSVMTSSSVHYLPLHEKHLQKSAKMGLFGDWEVPLYYTSILEEHEAVRNRAGIFDISHMGKFYFHGPRTVEFLDRLLPRSIAAMRFGQALYMPLLTDEGGFVDDIIVYRISEQAFYMIVNAGNVQKDYKWITGKLNDKSVIFEDLSPEMGLLALQGPSSAAILEKAFPGQGFSNLKYYSFVPFRVTGTTVPVTLWQEGMVARTGYTGEDGYEIMALKSKLPAIWDALMEAGKSGGVVPIGFGARDTLRLEAGMLLYGHDMNDQVTPLEAGISWALDWKKSQSVGMPALIQQQAKGIEKTLVGFEMVDRGIPRQDYPIAVEGKEAGKVTSGSFSPTLKKNIGLGYVPVKYAAQETEIQILIRDKFLKAKVVKPPFYKRKK